jgi:hypothetical protein
MNNGPEILRQPERTTQRPPAPKPLRERPREKVLSFEEQRREDIAARSQAIQKMDWDLFVSPGPEGPTEYTTERLKTFEALVEGDELSSQGVENTTANVNSVNVRSYEREGKPDHIKAFVKSLNGETTYRYDESQGKLMCYRRVVKNGKLVEEAQPYAFFDEEEKAYVEAEMRRRAANEKQLRRDIADAYNIKTEDIPLPRNRYGAREGIDSRNPVIREVGASRINELALLDSVPLTAARAEADNSDLLSLQEALVDKRTGKAPPHFSLQLFNEFRQQGKEHRGAKSLMRVACLDYLIKSADRASSNLLVIDDVDDHGNPTLNFKAIDNTLSFGLSRAVETADERGTTKRTLEPIDAYRSVPMQLAAEHEDWFLDSEARSNLRALLGKIESYNTWMSEHNVDSLSSVEKNQRDAFRSARYVNQLFEKLYGNPAVAEKEKEGFIERLRYLVENGRPPQLPDGSNGNALMRFREDQI